MNIFTCNRISFFTVLAIILAFSAARAQTLYSFKSGDYNDPQVWTLNSSGITYDNPGNLTPVSASTGSGVVILAGRTIAISPYFPSAADIYTVSNSPAVTIQEGGVLEVYNTVLVAPAFSNLSGQGILLMHNTNNLPTGIASSPFVQSGGGTVEYNFSTTSILPAQDTYNNLTINLLPGVKAKVSRFVTTTANSSGNFTLNGNLSVKQGTFQIGDDVAPTADCRLNMYIAGSVTVSAGAAIGVGTANTNNSYLTAGEFAGNTNDGANNGSTPQSGPFYISRNNAYGYNPGNSSARGYNSRNSNLPMKTGVYHQIHHQVFINSGMVNNGTVRFHNLEILNLDQISGSDGATNSNSGAATVYFQGNSNDTLTLNGKTDFYNLVVDKGTDPTFSLTINPSDYQNFRLWGPTSLGADHGFIGPTNPNPIMRKSLWIKNGTLKLTGKTVIPSLSESSGDDFAGNGLFNGKATALDPTGDFYVPANAAMVIDGQDVIVLITADYASEVAIAYGLPLANVQGVFKDQNSGNQSLSIYGAFTINSGYLSSRESGGIIYWSIAGGAGNFTINGGIVDAKQFRTAEQSTPGRATFTMTGGTLHLRGRFQNFPQFAAITLPYTPVYPTFADINGLRNLDASGNPIASTIRATNGLHSSAIGTLNIARDANVFTMTGGTITVLDVGQSTTKRLAFEVNSTSANINVTGGNVNIKVIHGTGNVVENFQAGASDYVDDDYYLVSAAPLSNLTITRAANATKSVILTGITATGTTARPNQPLAIQRNLTINSAPFNASGLGVFIGGNFSLDASATYTTGPNTTTFNGTGNQNFLYSSNSNLPAGLKNLTVNKSSGTLAMGGDGTALTVNGSLSLLGGQFNDNGVLVIVKDTVTNSATHVSTNGGKIILGGSALQMINGNGNGIFANLQLNNASGAQFINGGQTITDQLNLENGILDIGAYPLTITSTLSSAISPNTSTGTYSNTNMIRTAGNQSDGGVIKKYGNNDPFVFPVGTLNVTTSANEYSPATIAVTASTYGTITVRPVSRSHPFATLSNHLNRYWKVIGTGFSANPTVSHTYQYLPTDVTPLSNSDASNPYVAAVFNPNAWTTGTNAVAANRTFNFPNLNYITGEFTAGKVDNFGNVIVFYSRANGNWNTASTWSTVALNGPAASSTPTGSNPVYIGNGSTINHTITISNSDNGRSAGILHLNKGSVLDLGTATGHDFGALDDSLKITGAGTLRISTTSLVAEFPKGDFGNFLGASGGTIDYYTTGTSSFTLPTASADGRLLSTYYNLIVSPSYTSAITITMPDRNLRLYGDLTVNGNANGVVRLSDGTYGGQQRTITINGNLNINGGKLRYSNGSVRNILLDGTRSTNKDGNGSKEYGKIIIANATTTGIEVDGTVVTGGVLSVTVTNAGSNYTSTPAVSITGGGSGSGATAVAYMSGNTVSSVSITNPGSGYSTATPLVVTFTGGGGSGAAATASLSIINTLALTGSLINNGTLILNPGNNKSCSLSFLGDSNEFFSGQNAGGTRLNSVTINKGTSQSRTLTLDVSANLFGGAPSQGSPPSGWLNLVSGTFRYVKSGANTNLGLSSTGNAYSIPAIACISMEASVSTSSLSIGTGTSDGSDLALAGKLKVASGILNIGTTALGAYNNDIEYAAAGLPEIEVTGGRLYVNGQIRRPAGTNITLGSLVYNQSGGDVIIGGNSSASGLAVAKTRAKFEIDNGSNSSVFNMSGGTLTILRGGGNVSDYGDLYIHPGSSLVTGGTIYLAPSNSSVSAPNAAAPQTFTIDSSIPLYSLVVGDGSGNTSTVNMNISSLRLNGSLTINGNINTNTSDVLNTNGLGVRIRGNFTNSGTYNAVSNAGIPNTTTFSGPSTGNESANQLVTLNTLTTFGNLTMNKLDASNVAVGTLSFAGNNSTISGNLILSNGTLNDGGTTITVEGNITNSATHTSTGTGKIKLQGPNSQLISGNDDGKFGNLTLDNVAGVSTSANITVNGTLEIASDLQGTGGLYINDNVLALGPNATITSSSPFNSDRMIRTNGVLSDGGLVKVFANNLLNTVFLFPVGVTGKYTPANYTLSTNGSGGSVAVKPINAKHPNVNPASGLGPDYLSYYWNVKSTVASLNHQYFYVSDVANGNTSNYISARFAGTIWTTDSDVDEGNRMIPYNSSPISGDYTAGEIDVFENPATFTSNATSMDWETNNWVSSPNVGNGPPKEGSIVIIRPGDVVTVNSAATGYTPKTTNSLTISGTLDLGSTDLHNFGTVDGTGLLKVSAKNTDFAFPAGNYDAFTSATGGTIEYYGTASGTLLTQSTFNKVVFSGNSTKELIKNILVNSDLTIHAGTVSNTTYNKNITLKGNWANNVGTTGFAPGTGTIIFNSGTVQSIGVNPNPKATIFNNVTIAGTSTSVINNADLTANGNITIGTTTSFQNTGNNIITLKGNWTNNGSFIVGSGTSAVVLNGTNQIIGGTSSTAFKNLTIQGGGNKTLSQPTSISGQLTLTDGYIVSSTTNLLKLGEMATATGASDVSFVSGPMTKDVPDILPRPNFTFPVGKVVNGAGRYAKIDLLGASDATYTAEYFAATPKNNGNYGSPLTGVTDVEYWNLTSSTNKSANIKLTYRPSSNFPAVTTPASLAYIVRYDANANPNNWINITSGQQVASNSGSIQTDNSLPGNEPKSFGLFTFGFTSSEFVGLPVRLLTFQGKWNNGVVDLEWLTVSEENNSYFDVERSSDAHDFVTIGRLDGKGTTNFSQNYRFTDESPLRGTSYYRLKQVDSNGDFEYSKIISVTNLINTDVLVLYPNPVNNSEQVSLQIDGAEERTYLVTVHDMQGKILARNEYVTTQGLNELPILEHLHIARGMYFIRVQTGHFNRQFKLIVD